MPRYRPKCVGRERRERDSWMGSAVSTKGKSSERSGGKVSCHSVQKLGVRACLAFAVLGGLALAPTAASASSSSRPLTVALMEPPISINAYGANDVDPDTLEVNRQVFGSLVVAGTRPGTFTPGLAVSWKREGADGWKFTLKSGVKFANGRELTSRDVVASLETLAKSGTALSSLWTTLSSVTAPNSDTVVIRTTQPMGTMLDAISLLPIAPANDVKSTSFWNHPFGTGPYRVTNFVPDQSITLRANARYQGPAPATKTIDLIAIPNASDLTSYIKSGRVDIAIGVDPSQASSLTGQGLKVKLVPSYTYYFIWFNASVKPFNNVLVRQAMEYALPLKSIVRAVWGKYGVMGTGPIPSTVFGYHKVDPYPYDPAKARALLAKAGYPSGFSSSMMYEVGQAPFLDRMSAVFVSEWAAVGIHIDLQPLPPATWLSNLVSLKWNMDFQSNTVSTGDADFTLGRLYTATADRFGYKNAYLTSLLQDARSSVNPQLRQRLYARAIDFIMKEALGIFPVQVNDVYVWRNNVHGFTPTPSGVIPLAGVSAS